MHTLLTTLITFYSAPQCSHCKRCTSYVNSVCLPACLSVCPSVRHTLVLCHYLQWHQFSKSVLHIHQHAVTMCRKILKMVCVFAEDEDNMQLVSTETSSSKKCESLLADENSGSPEVLASDGTAFVSLADNTGDRQHSVQGCMCVENTSALSPTRVTHCLLNSVMSSSVQVEIMNKHHASRVSDRTQGLFMALP